MRISHSLISDTKNTDTNKRIPKEQAIRDRLNSSRRNIETPSEYGNIDLNNRPIYRQPDGSISTVRSMGINEDGKEVLIPTIGRNENGAYQMSDDEAIDHYHRTGEHLGKFNTVEGANQYAEWLHNQQEKQYGSAYRKAFKRPKEGLKK